VKRPADPSEAGETKPAQAALESTSPLEWVIAAMGGALVAATLAYLVICAMAEPPRPPAVTLSVTSVTTTPGGYLVSFRAENTGGQTAAGLQITGELRDGEVVVESREATLDYLPQQSERRGGLFFTHDPAAHEVSLRAHGYADP